MWNMILLDDGYKKTVNDRMFGVEPKLAKRMLLMPVGDTIYSDGYYSYQIIRIS